MVTGKILAIGAHPDDVEFGCGGLLQHYTKRYIVVCTLGECGGAGIDRGLEAHRAAAELEAHCQVLSFPDTNIPLPGLITSLEVILSRIQPNLICIAAEKDTHQDHRTVYQAGIVASRDSEATVLGYISPSAAINFSPNWFAALTQEQFDKKLCALRCHSSQRERPYLSENYLLSTAKYWALVSRAKHPFVEPFVTYRHWSI